MPRIRCFVITLLAMLASLPVSAGWDEGVAAYTAQNYDLAIREFAGVVQQRPDWAGGQYMLGVSLQQVGRGEEALNHLRRAYDLEPANAAYQFGLGTAYFRIGRHRDAAALFNRMNVTSLPSGQHAEFLEMRVQSNFESGGEAGLDDLRALVALRPDDVESLVRYGSMAASSGDWNTGIGALGRAMQLAPYDAEVTRSYLHLLVRVGQSRRDPAARQAIFQEASAVAARLVSISSHPDDLAMQQQIERVLQSLQ